MHWLEGVGAERGRIDGNLLTDERTGAEDLLSGVPLMHDVHE